jgi:hypothetical protein
MKPNKTYGLDRLAFALLEARRASSDQLVDDSPSHFLFTRVKSRIQEMREQSLNSWESAVTRARGWLAAFAITAAILIAINIQWQSAMIGDLDNESDEQNPAEYYISDIPDPGSEDNPYANK